MIDIHSHIIPEVDDGAESLEESLQMLQIAENDGISKMVATPHTFSVVARVKDFTSIKKRFEDLQAAMILNGLQVELYLGAENSFDASLKDNLPRYKEFLTINESRYFLLEFPFNFVFPGSERFLRELVEAGFIPIIVHPERIIPFQQDPGLLFSFLNTGCLSQINGGSLRGDFGSDAMHAGFLFLKKNWVHMIASDAHNTADRIPVLSYLKTLPLGIESEKLKWLTHDVPEAIINNEVISDPGPYLNPRRSRSLFSFFKPVQE